MPRYKVKLEDGRTARIETESAVESNEQMQQILSEQMGGGQRADVASPDQFLSLGERAKTGFRVEPEKFLEEKRASLGLSPGTPLEPTPATASLMANIKDIPGDIIDMLGPAFPAVGQMFGGAVAGAASIPTTGGVAAPLAVAGGGIVGAAGGEVMRQAVGEFLKLEDTALSERAKRVAIEGAFGAVGEAAFLGGSIALRATKKGLIKTGEKLLSAKGLEGFVKGFGKITRNLGPDEFKHALTSLKQGDDTVLKKAMASEHFGNKFSRELFFGEKVSASGKILKKGNVARQIKNLASRKDAREPVKQLYKEFLGLSDETLDMAIKHGSSIDKFGSQSVIEAIEQINKKIPSMFDDVGKRLGKARTGLAARVPGADVSKELSAVNGKLGDELVGVGMLNKVADGVYSINPEYAITAQGKGQAGSFANFITKFFGKPRGMSSAQESLIKKAIIEGDVKTITDITRGKFFTAQVKSNFGDFAKNMKSLEAQISGKEFQQLGKLSPNLTTYMQGLRSITESVADKAGDFSVKALSQEYKLLVQNADLLRNGSKVKSVDELSRVMSKYLNPKDVIEQQQAKGLESFLRKQAGSDIFERVRGFKALNQLKGLETDLTKTAGRQRFANMMGGGFNPSIGLDTIESNIDIFLPKHLKIALNAKNHTTAVALQKDALSILKARFLSSGLGIPGTIGAVSGGAVKGVQGATTGLMAGIGLQNPKLLQFLLRVAAKAPEKRALNIPLKGLTRPQTIGGTQILKGLINKNSR